MALLLGSSSALQSRQLGVVGSKHSRRGHDGFRIHPQVTSRSSFAPSQAVSQRLDGVDLKHLQSTAHLADSSAGITQPHPNAACLLVGPNGQVIASSYQRAQGTVSAEVQAVAAAGGAARGSTAYLNLETGDCHGESAAVEALVQGGVSRVVLGLRHPLAHVRGRAVKALRVAGLRVDVLGETPVAAEPEEESAALMSCLAVNEALLHRAALRRPLSVLKYAMTLDGKIATQMGHSAWVTSPQARAMVFEQRARSDAVIVGGNTVRRDNPRLTTRRDTGHMPVRVVMSRTLDLPADAELWDVTTAPTIVMTQRGARQKFQAFLRSRGVEVVEFDFLTPENVADYCYERGFLQCFWECGGTLAAPCISSTVIHKVMAFVAPKIIGGARAPTPVGELGFVEMTQAVQLVDTTWRQVGPDLMMTGYLPSSGGLPSLEATLADAAQSTAAAASPSATSSSSSATTARQTSKTAADNTAMAASDAARRSSGASASSSSPSSTDAKHSAKLGNRMRSSRLDTKVARFYKAWDRWGSLGNFSPHTISMPDSKSGSRDWPSVEHYYQAHKFMGTGAEGAAVMEAIAAAPSPEEAARIGRHAERTQPELVRPDWSSAKIEVMMAALRAKFSRHEGPRALLLSSVGHTLVESSPHDFFWGQGYDGTGQNHLGRLLMQLRDEMLATTPAEHAAGSNSSSSSSSKGSHGSEVAGVGRG